MRTPEDTPSDPDRLIRLGAIASVDLASARCTVTLEGDETTPALPWIEAAMGETRAWSPPSIGEQVMLLCPAGELAGAWVLRGLACTAFAPAGTTRIDRITFSDGAVVEYDAAAHAMAVTLSGGGALTVAAPGGVTITGDVTVTGTLTASVDVLADGKSLKGHKHGGVSTGGGQTGTPV